MISREDLKSLTIKKASEGLTRGDFSSVELTQAYLDVIKERNKELNVYLEVFADALDQAKEADEKIKRGEKKFLTGIPLAIKDNILIKGRTCSSASKMLENYKATYDATVIKKLKEEGVVFLGRTNMDEFAMGGSTENSAYGPTRNPHDATRVSGGSSGGSAAAVGGEMALAALGSDTGGSIRQPSSFCGTVGLKPTYGTVSRFGVMAMASSLDQIGPITRTVEDTEILFNLLSEKDKNDSTSVGKQEGRPVPEKFKIGVPYSFLNQGGIDQEVLANFQATMEKLKAQGHEIVEVEMPNLHYSLACYYVLMPAEASTNLARFDGVRYGLYVEGKNGIEDYFKSRAAGFGPEVRRRIMLGTYVLSAGYYDAYYGKAIGVRDLIKEDYRKAFEKVDLVATPTAPSPAFPIGKNTSDPLQMYLEDIFTVPVNLAGVPAMSVPSGWSKDKMPLGIQFTAPHFSEALLFAAGKIVEKI